MIIQCPIHGIEEEKFADIVDRFAVVDGVLVISVPGSVQPVLVLCLVLPSGEGVLKLDIAYAGL